MRTAGSAIQIISFEKQFKIHSSKVGTRVYHLWSVNKGLQETCTSPEMYKMCVCVCVFE